MSISQKLVHELRALVAAFLFFVVWLGALVVVKKLILDEYQVEFRGLSAALLGALVLSKVVLLLEPVPLGVWIQNRPAWVGVVLRTALYVAGVVVVLLLEKALHGRHEYGGMGPALKSAFQNADIYHVFANTICLSGAILVFNMLAVIRHGLGKGGLTRLFTTPLNNESKCPGTKG